MIFLHLYQSAHFQNHSLINCIIKCLQKPYFFEFKIKWKSVLKLYNHGEICIYVCQSQSDQPRRQEANEEEEYYGQEEQPPVQVPPPQPKIIVANKSSILLSRCHTSEGGTMECSYCNGKRTTYMGDTEEGITYHKIGFTSTKFRYDDYEAILAEGFTRCGTYFYMRNFLRSCCEAYQYRVDFEKFEPSHSQKKAMKKFHNYINYGHVKGAKAFQEEKPKAPVEDVKMNENETVSKDVLEVVKSCMVELGADPMKLRVTFNQKLKCIQSNILFIAPKIPESSIIEAVTLITEAGSIVKSENGFINVYSPGIVPGNFVAISKKQEKVHDKIIKSLQISKEEEKKVEAEEGKQEYPQNHYKNYVIEFNPQKCDQEPVHDYTIEIHRAIFTDELYALYQRYERAVHGKERDRDCLIRFLCNSPVYDPVKDLNIAMSPSVVDNKKIDETFREFKDESVFPGFGTFHIIDGQLVAVTVIDILPTVLVSCYCIYDPDMKFLSLGVVTAVREFEYMRLLKYKYLPTLKHYQLGELVITCPKVNYKLNYKPGMIICPRTKAIVDIDKCIDQVRMVSSLPIEEKRSLPFLQLSDYQGEGLTKRETMVQFLKGKYLTLPFAYENEKVMSIGSLTAKGQEQIIGFLEELILNMEIYHHVKQLDYKNEQLIGQYYNLSQFVVQLVIVIQQFTIKQCRLQK